MKSKVSIKLISPNSVSFAFNQMSELNYYGSRNVGVTQKENYKFRISLEK